MPANYAGQPLPLFWDRKVSSLKKLRNRPTQRIFLLWLA